MRKRQIQARLIEQSYSHGSAETTSSKAAILARIYGRILSWPNDPNPRDTQIVEEGISALSAESVEQETQEAKSITLTNE